jgi:hypothetical protein
VWFEPPWVRGIDRGGEKRKLKESQDGAVVA